ncbi:uncharacterized protein PV06_07968 [Exophiala oligosperma]|uniref:Uncharacterized protein n=1 Tax=Exophiala oligosperma TaxID=215243 RepID=A0A0D2DE96_9EURO|nr:uncharacterized protein PV06_07968 [Exophiala oligosperma]KIW40795.1 hypothetical protein PV06_07968 [Exophiala oligosperma]
MVLLDGDNFFVSFPFAPLPIGGSYQHTQNLHTSSTLRNEDSLLLSWSEMLTTKKQAQPAQVFPVSFVLPMANRFVFLGTLSPVCWYACMSGSSGKATKGKPIVFSGQWEKGNVRATEMETLSL